MLCYKQQQEAKLSLG